MNKNSGTWKNLEKIIQVDSYIVVELNQEYELGKELWNCLRRAYPKEIILVWNTLGSNYPRNAYPRRLYWFGTRLVPIIPGRLIPRRLGYLESTPTPSIQEEDNC